MGSKNASDTANLFASVVQPKNMGAAGLVADALHFGKASYDPVPSAARTIMDMQRRFASPIERLGLGAQAAAFLGDNAMARMGRDGVGGFLAHSAKSRSTNLHERFAIETNLRGTDGRLGDLHRSLADLAATRTSKWSDVESLTKTFAADVIARQLRSFSLIDRRLERLLPEVRHAAWSEHLKTFAVGTLGFLGQDWSARVGLLTHLQGDEGCSISWLGVQRDEPVVMTAAVTDQLDVDTDFEVVADEHICASCEGPMASAGTRMKWVGPRRGVRQHLIFPVCHACWQKEKEDEGYLYRALCSLMAPALRVKLDTLQGEGLGDGRPAGRLRLVRVPDSTS